MAHSASSCLGSVPEDLWQATGALADALKEMPTLRTFRRAFDLEDQRDDFRQRLSEVTARYSPLRYQPMLLGLRLNEMQATGQLLQSKHDHAWLQAAVEAGGAFQVVVEYLRSRLPGYPMLRVPHLRGGSPHVFDDPWFIRGFPWDPEVRALSLHLASPPDMTKLGGTDNCDGLIADLLEALQERRSWTRFSETRKALAEADRRALSEMGREFAAKVEGEPVTEAVGELSMARFNYRRAVLQETVVSAEGAVAGYLAAFEAIDELITVVAALMGTIITSGGLFAVEPYRLDIGQGDDLRPVELAARGDNPFLSPGEILLVHGPDPAMTGLVYPQSITHTWGRSNEPENSKITVSGKITARSDGETFWDE